MEVELSPTAHARKQRSVRIERIRPVFVFCRQLAGDRKVGIAAAELIVIVRTGLEPSGREMDAGRATARIDEQGLAVRGESTRVGIEVETNPHDFAGADNRQRITGW